MLSLTPTAHVEHIRIHADDSVASGPWRTQDGHKNGQAGLCLRIEAGALARAELERLLPGGHGTPDHYFYEINAGSEGTLLGYVWFANLVRTSGRVAYLVQLLVFPQHLRRGYGSETSAPAARRVVRQFQPDVVAV